MNQSPAAYNCPSPAGSTGGRRLTRGIYLAAVFLYGVTLYLYLPTLPTYIQSKTDNLALVGVVLSMYGLWQAVIRLPLGVAADWIGWCKPFILIGFVLAGLGAWTMGVADGVNGLIVGRAFTGLAAGNFVPLVVVFSSLFPPREAVRASTILTTVGSLGILLASSATGLLNEWGGYSLAFFLAVGTAGLAILIVLPARERRRLPRRPAVRTIGRLIARQDVLLPSLLGAVIQYVAAATTYGFLPILAKQLGATDVTQSMLMSVQVGMLPLGSLVAAAAITRRMGNWRVVSLSLVLLSVGAGLAALAPSLLLVFIAQCFIGFSWGTCYPVLTGMSIQDVTEAERNTSMGLYQTGCSLGVFGGSWVSGVLADMMGIRPMFGLTASLCLALGFLVSRRLVGNTEALNH